MRPAALRWGLNALLLAASLAVCALILEGMIRVALPQFDTSGHVRFSHPIGQGVQVGQPDSIQRQIKNTGDFDVEIRFNAVGLRDARPPAQAAAGAVLVVGDSFTFGWGVAEGRRYSDLLAPALGRTAVNIAVPTDFDGYARLLAYAREQGAAATSLVVGVCMENDLTDYDRPPEAPAAAHPAGAKLSLGAVKGWLTEHSAAYFLLTTLVHRTPALKSLAIRSGLLVENLAGMQRTAYAPQVVAASARRLQRLVAGFDATILIVPARALWIGAETERAEARRIHDEFTAALAGLGLRVVDPRPAFERGDPLSFHFKNDGHWNEAGHALAAGLLAAAMKE